METDAAGEFVLSADGARIPLVAAGAELTPEVQARLRSAGVRRVRVKEFDVGRWQHAWLFETLGWRWSGSWPAACW